MMAVSEKGKLSLDVRFDLIEERIKALEKILREERKT